MGRPLRIEYAGAVYHVTSRGNGRQAIFLDDGDRTRFLSVLEKVVRRFRWRVHAYCLMGNHYHLLVETPEPNLSLGMRTLNGEVTRAFHRRHGTVGHLLQGRFASVLVEKESHLLELCRYVVLNPVRAATMGIHLPEEWPWSSYRGTAGLSEAPPFLHTGWLLTRFSADRPSAQRLYREFVREGIGRDSPLLETRGGLILGGDRFASEVLNSRKEFPIAREHPRTQRTADRPPLELLLPPECTADIARRNAAAASAHLLHGYTQKAIADHLGLHYATVCRIVQSAEDRRSDAKDGDARFET